MDTGLLLLRLVVGLTLASHGAQKLFGWFGGYGLAGTGGFLESIGFRPGKLQAALAGLAEFGGGLLLALGLVTPIGSILVFAVMMVATMSVHWSKGFFSTGGGIEYTLVLGVAGLSLAFTGPGQYSLDAVLGVGPFGVQSGLIALGAGLAGSIGALVTRSAPRGAASKA